MKTALAHGVWQTTERAIGLARRRRWAEYLTVIAGCIGIPLEVSQVLNRQTPVRINRGPHALGREMHEFMEGTCGSRQ